MSGGFCLFFFGNILMTSSCPESCFLIDQSVLSQAAIRSRDHMVVGFTTTFAGEVYSIQNYVIKFVSDLRQVCGFLWILQFPPPIKLTAMI
jgi:hypothetical protein